MANLNQEPQKYRAGVGALIVNKNKEILMVQNNSFREDEWDFTKGGMHMGESEMETLEREISEELGKDMKYKVLRRSSWYVIYEWPVEKQEREGMRGAARVSYWILHTEGEVKPLEEELRAIKWVKDSEFKDTLISSGWTVDQYAPLLEDWERLKKDFAGEFNN
jgi:8-oxo-dGTP pyrophosphatase MutT (NUDIX family)